MWPVTCTALALAASVEAAAITLSVQLVDKGWMPVPGVEAIVRRVDSCSAGSGSSTPILGTSTTNKAGWADFDVTAMANYTITVKSQGGFKGASKCIRLYNSVPAQPHAYVQIQLQVKQP
jgi:hypothetical protein